MILLMATVFIDSQIINLNLNLFPLLTIQNRMHELNGFLFGCPVVMASYIYRDKHSTFCATLKLMQLKIPM